MPLSNHSKMNNSDIIELLNDTDTWDPMDEDMAYTTNMTSCISRISHICALNGRKHSNSKHSVGKLQPSILHSPARAKVKRQSRAEME